MQDCGHNARKLYNADSRRQTDAKGIITFILYYEDNSSVWCECKLTFCILVEYFQGMRYEAQGLKQAL